MMIDFKYILQNSPLNCYSLVLYEVTIVDWKLTVSYMSQFVQTVIQQILM